MSSVGHVGQACYQCVGWIKERYGRVRARFNSDDGVNLVEYALLISLIALVAMSAMRYFAGNVTNKMSCNAEAIQSAAPGPSGRC